MNTAKAKRIRRIVRKEAGAIGERAVRQSLDEIVRAGLRHRLAACVYILFGKNK